MGRAAAAAAGRRPDHNPFTRQVLGERLAHGLAPLERRHLRRLLRGFLGPDRILARRRLQLLELQFELVDQPGGAFGAAAIHLALEPGDLELQPGDHRLRGRDDGLRPGQFGFRGGQLGAQSLEFRGGIGHGRGLPRRVRKAHGKRQE